MSKLLVKILVIICLSPIVLLTTVLSFYHLLTLHQYYQFSDSVFTHWQIWIFIFLEALLPFFLLYWLIKRKGFYIIASFLFIFWMLNSGEAYIHDLAYLRTLAICDDERSRCEEATKEFEQAFGKIKKEEPKTDENLQEKDEKSVSDNAKEK